MNINKWIAGTLCFLFLGLIYSVDLKGQFLLGFHTEYDDSFREWIIVYEEDSLIQEGYIDIMWPLDDNFNHWEYRVGENYGEIYQKYRNNPSLWELRAGGRMITIRQVWPGDIREWKITDGNKTLVVKSVNGNILDDWSIPMKVKDEFFNVFTEYEGDPRDWKVDDYLNESIPFDMRMAAAFIPILNSIPRY